MVASKSLVLMEPKVQLLANFLVTGGAVEVTPTIDHELGVRYLEVERLTGDDPETVKNWLEQLATDGVLKGRFVDKLIICPKCGSNNTPVHYCCPVCRSVDIDKKALFEHLACGVIDKEDNFRKNAELVCPRCSRQLGELGITHKAVGTWFLCRSCLKPFDRPQSFHVCGKCKHFFAVEDAIFTDVLAYGLSEEAEAKLRSGGLFLKPLRDTMEGLGYKVAVAGFLRGASGTDHVFDLVGSRKKGAGMETVVVDVVASDGLVTDSSVTGMFAKRYDTNPDKSVLVVIPGISENGKKLANLYKIDLIEAGTAPEAIDKLRLSLRA